MEEGNGESRKTYYEDRTTRRRGGNDGGIASAREGEECPGTRVQGVFRVDGVGRDEGASQWDTQLDTVYIQISYRRYPFIIAASQVHIKARTAAYTQFSLTTPIPSFSALADNPTAAQLLLPALSLLQCTPRNCNQRRAFFRSISITQHNTRPQHIPLMAPTRRVKTARAASQRPPFPPTPSGSEEYSDHDMDPDATYNPSSTHPRASPYHRHAQGAYPLQRGTACLSCRKRKMVRVPSFVDSFPIIRLPLPSLVYFIRNAMAQSLFANSVPRQIAPPIASTMMASPRLALSSSRRRSNASSREFINSKGYPRLLLNNNQPTLVALYHTPPLHQATS